jgi:hypothetical protein
VDIDYFSEIQQQLEICVFFERLQVLIFFEIISEVRWFLKTLLVRWWEVGVGEDIKLGVFGLAVSDVDDEKVWLDLGDIFTLIEK